MAKFLGNVVVLEETNLPALFYFKYLCESYSKELKYPPVQYYDEMNKKGVEIAFQQEIEYANKTGYTIDQQLEDAIVGIERDISSVTKTVYHGFKYTPVHENVKDEGLAKKQMQAIQKMIKNHEAPYNDIFKKYSVTIIQG